MSSEREFVVLCNSPPAVTTPPSDALHLNYLEKGLSPNVRINLPGFVRGLFHLSPRLLDLLEIAAYVYAADRYAYRGRRDAVEYQSWARYFYFHIKVRDFVFWSQPSVSCSLQDALLFITGDARFDFTFYPGHDTPPADLFDYAGTQYDFGNPPPAVSLFSGGIDSLAGAIDLIDASSRPVLLVSHQSQPGTKRTQKQLFEALKRHYGEKVVHYAFECNLHGARGIEESQRSRSFLYTAIALAVASASRAKEIHVFENGVTSMNFVRRQDLINGRASRTTHPKSLRLLEALYSLVMDAPFTILAPYLSKTKAEVIRELKDGPHAEFISSTVSCGRTIHHPGEATHCGTCFQCIDRRIAAYAAGAEGYDHAGLYYDDVVGADILSGEARTTAVDYIRQAIDLSQCSVDSFQVDYINELTDIIPYLSTKGTELDLVESVYGLQHRHGLIVLEGLNRMRSLHDDLRRPLAAHSLLGLIESREHLRLQVDRLIDSVVRIVKHAIPMMFRPPHRPASETDLNQKVAGLLKTHYDGLRSEHPAVSFACAGVVPDHQIEKYDLLIEVKYVRDSTSPSKATDGMAADLIKYPSEKRILFLVYDPSHKIPDDTVFIEDFEGKGRCRMIILR